MEGRRKTICQMPSLPVQNDLPAQAKRGAGRKTHYTLSTAPIQASNSNRMSLKYGFEEYFQRATRHLENPTATEPTVSDVVMYVASLSTGRGTLFTIHRYNTAGEIRYYA